jgi:glutamine synthetase
VRIPAGVASAQRGYLEDRRPNANIDPYVVAALMTETICGAASASAVKKVAAKRTAVKKTVKKAPVKKTAVKKAAKKTVAKKVAKRANAR